MSTEHQNTDDARDNGEYVKALRLIDQHARVVRSILDPELRSMHELFATKMEAVEKAVAVASKSLDVRLESMNEFRDTLRDQASRFVTRTELEKESERTESDLRILRESRADLAGKASQRSVSTAAGVAVFALLISVLVAIAQLVFFVVGRQ